MTELEREKRRGGDTIAPERPWWAIFAGFYLVAYVFWVPRLFSSLPNVIVVAALTLVVGAGLLRVAS